MPIQFLYTDKEILKMRKDLLMKSSLTQNELSQLQEINNYVNAK